MTSVLFSEEVQEVPDLIAKAKKIKHNRQIITNT